MLSPYLFSANMTDFCKKFNEITKDYLNTVWVPVSLYTDVVEKHYIFYIKAISISMLILYYYETNKELTISFLYDVMLYSSKTYSLTKYKASLLVLSILKGFVKSHMKIRISDYMKIKVISNGV